MSLGKEKKGGIKKLASSVGKHLSGMHGCCQDFRCMAVDYIVKCVLNSQFN